MIELGNLASLLAAPALYYVCGLPWALAAGRLHWAPLFGLAVFGLAAELAYIASVDTATVAIVTAGVHGIAAATLVRTRYTRAPNEVMIDAREFLASYVLALVPLAIAPFPLPGRWAGDWIIAMETGYAVFTGAALPGFALTRPPLFGAATAPLWCFGDKMISFQILSAIGSAACLQVVRHLLPVANRAPLLWTIAGSLFFLQVTAAAWSKFTAAAFILAAWQSAGEQSRRTPYVAGALTGLALATHQASVLFAPLVVIRLLTATKGTAGKWYARIPSLAVFGMVAALFCLPWESFTITRYGLEAKAAANPALATRPDIPAWANTLLAGATTLGGWGPVEAILSLASEATARDSVFASRAVFWIATSTFNTAAGTLLLLVLPAWFAAGSATVLGRFRLAWQSSGLAGRLAWAVAFAGHAVLIPYYSPDGSLQAGWVPAGLALLIWLAHQLAAEGPTAVRRSVYWTLGSSYALWIVFQLGLGAALHASAAARARLRDTDLIYIREQSLSSLGSSMFPWLQVSLLALASAILVRALRPGRQL